MDYHLNGAAPWARPLRGAGLAIAAKSFFGSPLAGALATMALAGRAAAPHGAFSKASFTITLGSNMGDRIMPTTVAQPMPGALPTVASTCFR